MRIISSGSALDERDSSALSLPLFSNRIPGEKLRSLHVIQTCTIPIVAPSRDYVYKQNHCLWMTCSTVPSSTPLCLAHFVSCIGLALCDTVPLPGEEEVLSEGVLVTVSIPH